MPSNPKRINNDLVQKILAAQKTIDCIKMSAVTLLRPVSFVDQTILKQLDLMGSIVFRYKAQGFSLNYLDQRIAGINHKRNHRNPGGNYVDGWHWHLWIDKFGNANTGVEIRELPRRRMDVTPDQLLDFCCAKWNIRVDGRVVPEELFPRP